MLAAGLLCILIGAFFASQNLSQQAKAVLRHVLLELAELLLFLFVAMTCANTT
jgi:hypothetical protein